MLAFSNRTSERENLFAIPIRDQFLIYAPLHDLVALVDRTAVLRLREALFSGQDAGGGRLGEIAHVLQNGAIPPPQPRQGDLSPAFLGLLPTRGCNFACRYCGFLTPDEAKIMDLELTRDAVDWYMGLVAESGQRHAEVHYFGGEPFCVPEVLDLAVHLARIRAGEIGSRVRFEVATNGAFSEERCRWAADNLDTIVLSLDGPADIQDWQRPYRDGRGSFEVVARNAGILSEGATDLFFRSCVTAWTVDRMPEIAAWFCRNYRPLGVCFEPIQPTPQSQAGGLETPDPWTFARNFVRAAEVLEAHGVEAVYAAADIRTRRASFCPVGRDAVIVSPDGVVSACYLLRQDWEARGLDLCLGRINGDGTVELDAERVASARRLNVWNKPLCAHCFCKWHCAGGCHVNHPCSDPPGSYDRLCLQTRIIALRNILEAMGRRDLVHGLLEDAGALERAARQGSDALAGLEDRL